MYCGSYNVCTGRHASGSPNSQVSHLPVSMDGNVDIKSREEVIYAVAASDGSINAVYAVNHFAIARAGKLTDYGKFTRVTNLTNTDPLTYAMML